ncbi:MAG: hypothetical protein AAF666_09130 [Pseudomonadota bacterium]
MHNNWKRFAVYWIPRFGTDLAAFGRGWTGWCAELGAPASDEAARALVAGHPGSLWSISRHGLHAPICEPFKLAKGRSLWRLEHHLRSVAENAAAIPLPRFQVTVRTGRVVLALERTSERLEELQGRVKDAVHLVGRRKAARPSRATACPTGGIALEPSEVHPDRLVCPFDMPLTDQIEASAAYDLAADLYPQLSKILTLPQRVSDLALMGDPGGGRPWRLIQRYRLIGGDKVSVGKGPTGMYCPDERPMPPVTSLMGSDWDTVIP